MTHINAVSQRPSSPTNLKMSTPSTTTTSGIWGRATNTSSGLPQHASPAVASCKRNEINPVGPLKKPRRLSAADPVHPISNGSTGSPEVSLQGQSPTRPSLKASSGGASSSLPPPSQTGVSPGRTLKRARPETASSNSLGSCNGRPAPDRPLAPGLRMTPQVSEAASVRPATEKSAPDAARPAVTVSRRAIATQSPSPAASSPTHAPRPPATSLSRVGSPPKSAAMIAPREAVGAGRRGALADAAEDGEMPAANDLLTLTAAAGSRGNGSSGRRRCRAASEAVNSSTECGLATGATPGVIPLAGNVTQPPKTVSTGGGVRYLIS